MCRYLNQPRNNKGILLRLYERYKFEDEDEDGAFNTKDDFFNSLSKDVDKGIPIEDSFKTQLEDYQQKNSKWLYIFTMIYGW